MNEKHREVLAGQLESLLGLNTPPESAEDQDEAEEGEAEDVSIAVASEGGAPTES